mgnify:FL=1
MLPSLSLMSVLLYEWFQDQSEVRLLVEAVLCLLIGVGCGGFIVKSFIGREESEPGSSERQQLQVGKSVTEPAQPVRRQPAPEGGLEPETRGRPDVSLQEAAAGTAPLRQSPLAPQPGTAQADTVAESVVAASAANLSEKSTAAKSSSTGPDVLPPGPELSGLFDGLQNAASAAPSLDMKSADIKSAERNPATLKLEIAVSQPQNEQGQRSDSLKVEFAVKGTDKPSQTAETRKVVASLEEKVARIEAVAAMLEAAGRAERELEVAERDALAAEAVALEIQAVAAEMQALDLHAPDQQAGDPAKPRKLGTRELVRPLPDLKTVDEWLEHAVHLEERSNFDDAIKCYDKVAALEATNFSAWFRKGVLLRKKSCFEDAIYCMNYALRLDTVNGGALSEKGLCLVHLGRHEQALTWFDKALVNDSEFLPALLGKARCLTAMGKHKEALLIYDKALRSQPTNAEARKGRDESAAKCNAK